MSTCNSCILALWQRHLDGMDPGSFVGKCLRSLAVFHLSIFNDNPPCTPVRSLWGTTNGHWLLCSFPCPRLPYHLSGIASALGFLHPPGWGHLFFSRSVMKPLSIDSSRGHYIQSQPKRRQAIILSHIIYFVCSPSNIRRLPFTYHRTHQWLQAVLPQVDLSAAVQVSCATVLLRVTSQALA